MSENVDFLTFPVIFGIFVKTLVKIPNELAEIHENTRKYTKNHILVVGKTDYFIFHVGSRRGLRGLEKGHF